MLGVEATWSHQSPLWSSAGSAGSQFFCFLLTNDHFSSNRTSRVRGGRAPAPGERRGRVAGGAGQSDDGVAVDADEPPGGADAAPLVEVFEHRVGLPLGQMAAVERRALALGEPGPAAVAVELSELLVLADSTQTERLPASRRP